MKPDQPTDPMEGSSDTIQNHSEPEASSAAATPATGPDRTERIRRAHLLAWVALLLFVAGLALPAVNLAPWLPGLNVFILSFLGLFAAIQVEAPMHFIACLMGATANVLMFWTVIQIQRDRIRSQLWPRLALALTILVILPLRQIVGAEGGVVSLGYFCWVGCAVLLVVSARLTKPAASGSSESQPAPQAEPPTRAQIQSGSRGRFASMTILLLVVLVVGGFMLWKQLGRSRDARYAAEAERVVENFLRDAYAVEGRAVIPNHRASASDLGEFLSLEGTGVDYPVWNIQGYHFLDLRRTAVFSKRRIGIRIIVTEGRVTAPGLTTIGTPRIESGMIFVSHPKVKR